MIEDYAKHAAVWDWDGYDNTPEYEYWRNYANQFGHKVLMPMCALAQSGAYMAQKGLMVTAFDITEEMIREAKKRFGSVCNLWLKVADICDFQFDEKDFDFCFLATQDLHLLSDIDMVKKAFESIAAHMRSGACLALELVLPAPQSYEYPTRIFHPRIPNYTDRRVWKEGKGRYDAVEKRHYIEQIVYIQNDVGTESFDHSVTLQYFEREDVLAALKNAGFFVTGEYGNRNKAPWASQNGEWIVEAKKQ